MDIVENNSWTYFVDHEWRRIVVNKTCTNYEVSNVGEVRNIHTGKILSQYTDKYGYRHATIFVVNRQYHPGTHRFVAQAFIPNPENKPEVNHIDGNKENNCVSNLEWVTTSENVKHAFDNGLKSSKKGSANPLSKYTETQIREVCKYLAEGKLSNKRISEIVGINRKYITDIKKGKRWKHISSQYNIHDKGHVNINKKYFSKHIHLQPQRLVKK